MKITYLSHSCFHIETGSHRLIIDPFLTGNALAKAKPEEIECDFILVTHGHFDHIGDAVAIAKRTGATVISSYEVAEWFARQGVGKVHGMGLGGGFDFPFGRVKLTIAFHSSSYPGESGRLEYMGSPAGMIIAAEGKKIYHAGDTSLTVEMQLLGQQHQFDLAMLPIGDNFTMGPEDAVTAAGFLRAHLVVPMHFDTFPPIRQDPGAFVKLLAAKGIQGRAMSAGDVLTL